MAKSTTRKKDAQSDGPAVVVIGDSPAAHVAAIKLAAAKVPVALVDAGTRPLPDRLATLNPDFFALDPRLAAVRDRVPAATVRTVRFLGKDGESAETTEKLGTSLKKKPAGDPVAVVVAETDLVAALRDLSVEASVTLIAGNPTVESADERGVEIKVARQTLRPKLVIAADPLPAGAAALGAPSSLATAPAGHVHATYDPPAADGPDGSAADGLMPMALDLGDDFAWGWLLTAPGGRRQMLVQHAAGGDSAALLREWCGRLVRAGLLPASCAIDGRSVRSQPVALAGALQRDVVARRTLLCGAAGGFYSAGGETIYPAAWSAAVAADVAAKAVKADQVQDALGPYRGKWGSTLGDYLRGPQQNLRFLLPMIFKNPPMTDRMAEAVLRGQSLVK